MSDSQLSIDLRPTKFSEVIGQEGAVKTLQTKLAKGEVPRAVMFVGPPGTGKTTLARILAREAQGLEFPADLEPDFIECNAASLSGKDDMRELVEATTTYPMVGKYRVIMLDEAHELSKAAQNLLLMPTEKKESPILWIICTTETAKIIPALRTRFQILQLQRLSKKDVHTLLQRAADRLEHGDFADFEAEANLEHLDQPRPLLNAFENYHNGTPARDAVCSQTQTHTADLFEIAKAVVYGGWNTDCEVWGKPCKAIKTQITELEAEFKKRKKASEPDDATDDDSVSKEEALGRPEVAVTLRSLVGALLKNEVVKGLSLKPAACLLLLAECIPPPSDTAISYPVTIGALQRINALLNEGKKK
jgi:ATPase family protein associated with various cellular activities (AAA)